MHDSYVHVQQCVYKTIRPAYTTYNVLPGALGLQDKVPSIPHALTFTVQGCPFGKRMHRSTLCFGQRRWEFKLQQRGLICCSGLLSKPCQQVELHIGCVLGDVQNSLGVGDECWYATCTLHAPCTN